MPAASLARLVDQGLLERRFDGVFNLPGISNSHTIALHAASRKLGAVVSHQSAAFLHNLDRPRHVKPTVSVPRLRTKVFPGVTVHQLTDLTDDQIVALDGLPVTVPERTVIDLAAVLKQGHVERIVDNGLAARILDLERLQWIFQDLGRRGKPGTTPMRSILEARNSGYEAPDTELERRLLKVIIDAGLPRPNQQFTPEWLMPRNGRVDFSYPERRLVIEGDSRRWHTLLNSFEIDRLRDNAAQLAGWRILRFTWDEITHHPERVTTTIRIALEDERY
jgi:very-short-patch-repair endonuclease